VHAVPGTASQAHARDCQVKHHCLVPPRLMRDGGGRFPRNRVLRQLHAVSTPAKPKAGLHAGAFYYLCR
jgi:hypothetical protein